MKRGPIGPFSCRRRRISRAYVEAISPVSGSTISSAGLSSAAALAGLRRRVDP
jgi:hypothetical protein